jgi:hypothetical protein
VRSVSFSGTSGGLVGHGYEVSAVYGFSVILNETSTTTTGSTTLYTVNIVRTMGALIDASYCLRSCASSAHLANLSFHAWEKVDAWANLTTNATVTQAGPDGIVAALALLNSSVSVTAKLRESAASFLGSEILREGSLAVNITGHVSVNLSTPLGLFPITLVPGSTWNSSSTYAASGNVAWQDYYTYWAATGGAGVNGSGHGSGALNHSGSIGILGSYQNESVFTFGGENYPAVNLTVEGPFALREGVILVPASADLFGGSHPWSTAQNGSADVTTARVDVHPGALFENHLPLVASSAVWTSSTNDSSAALASGSTFSSALGPQLTVVPQAGVANATTVQGTPESVAQARSDQNCLVSGIGCPATAPVVPWARYILLGGVGVVVVALLSIGLIARRKLPAPVYPNARLYPPGQSGTGSTAPRPPPRPAEDDPLGHLW